MDRDDQRRVGGGAGRGSPQRGLQSLAIERRQVEEIERSRLRRRDRRIDPGGTLDEPIPDAGRGPGGPRNCHEPKLADRCAAHKDANRRCRAIDHMIHRIRVVPDTAATLRLEARLETR
jgi:hypothetical protein